MVQGKIMQSIVKHWKSDGTEVHYTPLEVYRHYRANYAPIASLRLTYLFLVRWGAISDAEFNRRLRRSGKWVHDLEQKRQESYYLYIRGGSMPTIRPFAFYREKRRGGCRPAAAYTCTLLRMSTTGQLSDQEFTRRMRKHGALMPYHVAALEASR